MFRRRPEAGVLKNLLVTGGLGFIGSNFIRHILKGNKGLRVVNLDLLTYASGRDNLRDLEGNKNYTFVKGDICSGKTVSALLKKYSIDTVVNFAAETHVDRSISDAAPFFRTNYSGVINLIDCSMKYGGIRKFVQISTDEVYGSILRGSFTEKSPLMPGSPYSASKAGADLALLAYHNTYSFPAVIARGTNNFGPFQYPEKLIPLFIINALRGSEMPVYGDGQNVRDWLFVEDFCRGIAAVIKSGSAGEIYNIGGGCEKKNIEVARMIALKLKAPAGRIVYVADRAGHDRRYSVSSHKIKKELGFSVSGDFEKNLDKTLKWYKKEVSWWKGKLNKRSACL